MSPARLKLYLVTDAPAAYPEGMVAGVDAAVAGGVTLVQYRPTTGTRRQWYEEARALHELLREREVPLIINDHLDLALAVDAEGAHVGQGDLPAEAARRLLGPGRILGLSITAPEQVPLVPPGTVDYLGAGPVFATATKADAAPPLGLAGLTRVVRATALPVVAIGGIQLSNTHSILATGAAGVAVVSALSRARDPKATAQEWLRLFPAPS